MNSDKDQLYQSEHPSARAKLGSFVFDQRVTEVFADMISRSVPGYQQILEMLPTLTRQFLKEQAGYYDLGCSLGAGMLAMAEALGEADVELIGVDNSEAMIEQASKNLSLLKSKNLKYRLLSQDLLDCEINSAAMVLMNFTLQFIPLEQRDGLVKRIFDGLLDGGSLVLSEKINFEDTRKNDLLIAIHHQYKADQGYSQLEIAQKRDAIENVLIPETLETHLNRLQTAGFRVVSPWVQNLQFISILAVK